MISDYRAENIERLLLIMKDLARHSRTQTPNSIHLLPFPHYYLVEEMLDFMKQLKLC